MVLVLFLLGVFLFLAVLSFLLAFSTLVINIEKMHLDNTKKENQKRKLEKDILIYIELHLFGKWKITKIRIDDTRIERSKIKEKLEKIDIQKIKKKIPFHKESFQMIKKIPVELEEFHLNIYFGTIDILFTTAINFILIMVVSIILPRLIKEYDSKRYQYEVRPIYMNENMVKLDFSGIIHIKMVHIMNILYLLLKKGRVNKHGTSNRRTYDYGYE